MMSGKAKLILIFSLALNAAFVAVWAHRRAGRAEPSEADENDDASAIWAQLGLDEDQASQFKLEWEELDKEARELVAEAQKERDRIFELMQADEVDRDAVRESLKRIGENRRKLRELATEHLLAAGSRLQPEQRRRWAHIMKQYADARGHRWRRLGSSEQRPWRGHKEGDAPPDNGAGKQHHAAGVRRRYEAAALLRSPEVGITVERIQGGVRVHVRADAPETTAKIRDLLPEYFKNTKGPWRHDGDADTPYGAGEEPDSD